MGLDISIKKIRHKHFDESLTLEYNFKNSNAAFVVEFREIWDLMFMFKPTKEEKYGGLLYRLLDKPTAFIVKDVLELEFLKTIFDNFDFDKFYYIIEFDF